MTRYSGPVGVALLASFMLMATSGSAGAGDCTQCSDAQRGIACIAKSFETADAKCRKTLSKNVGKVQKTAAKVSASCHKDRNADKRPATDDCNNMSVADSPKLKLDKAQQKFVDAMAKSCPGGTIGDGVLDEYVSCPEPCNTSLGISNPLTSYNDLASCLGCVAADVVATRNASTLGTPAAPLTSKDDAKCHDTLSKSWDKYLATVIKERSKCQDTAEAKENACGLGDTTCATDDEKGKISKALSKAKGGVVKKCGAADFSQFNLAGACFGVSDSTTYNDLCAEQETNATSDATVSATYSLSDQGICPLRIETTIRGGFGTLCATNADCAPIQTCAPTLNGVTRCQTSSVLDLGWTGEAHEVDVTDRYSLAADVNCPEEGRCSDDQGVSCSTNTDCAEVCIPADPCGNCEITGVAATGSSYESFTRCLGDTAIPCASAFVNGLPATDPACPSPGVCAYYLGPPLPVSAALNPVCSLLRISADITGTANPEDGSTEFTTDLLSKVFLGIGQTQPCPVCVGDPIPGDGLTDPAVCLSFCSVTGGTCVLDKDCPGFDPDMNPATPPEELCEPNGSCGVCDYGNRNDADLHNRQPCDVQGFQGTFANDDSGLGLSLDCPPADGKNISGVGLSVPIDFTTGTASLPFETNCDPPFPPPPAFVCACGVCSIDTAKPCVNNGDCLVGEGTCTSNGGGQAADRRPNQCSNLTCTDIGGGRGECTAAGPGDTLTYCDGQLRASGQGYITCSDNVDCGSFDPICSGGDCGDCTLARTRPCFVDPIVMTGSPDADAPLLAGTFCLPPTTNNAINATTGNPGPGRVRTQSIAKRVFK
jgi:hypothetical protein